MTRNKKCYRSLFYLLLKELKRDKIVSVENSLSVSRQGIKKSLSKSYSKKNSCKQNPNGEKAKRRRRRTQQHSKQQPNRKVKQYQLKISKNLLKKKQCKSLRRRRIRRPVLLQLIMLILPRKSIKQKHFQNRVEEKRKREPRIKGKHLARR